MNKLTSKFYLVGIKGAGIAFCLAKKFKKINTKYKKNWIISKKIKQFSWLIFQKEV